MAATEKLRPMPFAPRSAKGRARKLRLIADGSSANPAYAEALDRPFEIVLKEKPTGSGQQSGAPNVCTKEATGSRTSQMG